VVCTIGLLLLASRSEAQFGVPALPVSLVKATRTVCAARNNRKRLPNFAAKKQVGVNLGMRRCHGK
jgi:hypothetical protein